MAVNFSESMTKENLMRAFAGESQARNRYTIAAERADKEGMYTIAEIFRYTADQEREIPFDLSEILMPGEAYDLLEIWSGNTQDNVKNRLKSKIAPHGAVLYKITRSR